MVTPQAHLKERDLLERFRNADTRNDAFNALVHQYQQKIYWHIRKMVIDHNDADDLTQETFIKVWNNLLNFKGDSQLYTWLYRIATNECLRFLDKKKRRFFLPIVNVQAELLTKLESGNLVTGEEIQLKLQKALLTLPDKQRIVFNMKYFDDMKYEDISAILGTSVGALKASYHLAVKKIENFLNQD
jgi:RNA polymerase sigma-70 factor (ECF subfamily)